VAISRNCFEGGFKVFAPSTQDTAWPYARGRPEQNESRDDDPLGENVGIAEIVGLFEAFVFEPEDVEARFVAVEKPACPHCFTPSIADTARQVEISISGVSKICPDICPARKQRPSGGSRWRLNRNGMDFGLLYHSEDGIYEAAKLQSVFACKFVA